jgi:hypothetical protein
VEWIGWLRHFWGIWWLFTIPLHWFLFGVLWGAVLEGEGEKSALRGVRYPREIMARCGVLAAEMRTVFFFLP